MDDFTALDGALELDDLTDLLPHGPRAPRVSFSPAVPAPKIPAYLKQTYYWAYVNPRNVRWLDRDNSLSRKSSVASTCCRPRTSTVIFPFALSSILALPEFSTWSTSPRYR